MQSAQDLLKQFIEQANCLDSCGQKVRLINVLEKTLVEFKEDNFNDKWIIIPDFPSYEISSSGIVRNIASKKILKPSVQTGGYLVVSLSNKGVSKSKLIHRMVAELFLGITKEENVKHLNGNKRNNSVLNLEKYNFISTIIARHKDQPLVLFYKEIIAQKKEGQSYSFLARKYNCSDSTIKRICAKFITGE